MAKRSNRLKSQADYKSAMKKLRGKVRFDYDLRRNLSTGQKAAISRALNQLPTDQSARFIQPPKKAGESRKNYAKRLNTIKTNTGQAKTPFTGVFAKVGRDSPVSFENNQLNVAVPGFGYRETHIGIDRQRIAGNKRTRNAYLKRELKAAGKVGFTEVQVKLGLNRSMSFLIDDPEFLIEEINGWLNQYTKDKQAEMVENIIQGLIFIERE